MWCVLIALHLTAQFGHVQLADVLINHGAVINASEYQHGFTPLHLAAQAGHQAIIVSMLLAHSLSLPSLDVLTEPHETIDVWYINIDLADSQLCSNIDTWTWSTPVHPLH